MLVWWNTVSVYLLLCVDKLVEPVTEEDIPDLLKQRFCDEK